MDKGILSAVRKVEFVSDGMSYIILRGRWCNIIVLKVHAPCEDKGDNERTASMRNYGVFLIRFLGTI
jgi:hypothetical protein